MIIPRRELLYDPALEIVADPGERGRDGIDGRNGVDGSPGADAKGWTFRGEWHYSTKYRVDDIVTRDGSTFLCLKANTDREPPGRQWARIAAAGKDGKDGEAVVYAQRGRKGDKGDSGRDAGSTVTATFTEATARGMVLCVADDEQVRLAQANALETSKPIGLSLDNVGVGAAGEYVTGGPISVDDWTLATGGADLEANAIYFVSPDDPGKLTAVCPEASGQYVIIVGTALSARMLNIEIHRAYKVG